MYVTHGMRKALIFPALLIMFILPAARTTALDAINPQDNKNGYIVGPSCEILEDKGGKLTIDDVTRGAASGLFKKSTMQFPNFGYTKSAIWIKFALRIPRDSRSHWFLEVGYPALDIVELYVFDNGRKIGERTEGDVFPFDRREISYQNFLFRIAETPVTHTYYIKVLTDGAMSIPLRILSDGKLLSEINLRRMMSGMYYGILLIMIVFNLLLGAALRDRTYLYYVLYITGYLMISLVHDGTGFQYLWKNTLWLNNALPVAVFFCTFWGFIFMRAFLQTGTHAPRLDRFLRLYIALNLAGLAISYLLPYHVIVQVSVISSVFAAPIAIFTGFIVLRRGARQARYYLLAFAFVLMGITVSVFNRLGILPTTLFTTWIYELGIVLQLALLYLGLADKYNSLQKEKIQAQENALRIQKEATENLEMKVRERTIELSEANIKLTELDKIKSGFFANISHEIRTPLTLILSPVESALRGDLAGWADHAFLENIRRNSLHLLKLVNSLLDFSKIDAGHMTMRVREADIVRLMKHFTGAVRSAAELKGLELKFEHGDEPVYLVLDTEKIETAVMNILSNALKFTEKGGTITVGIGGDDGSCRIEIRDTGIGIPEDKLGTVFDRFSQADMSSTRRHEGTGIGLSLAREYIEMHGGRVTVESRSAAADPEGHGTVFTIILPKGKAHLEGNSRIEYVAESALDQSISDYHIPDGIREEEHAPPPKSAVAIDRTNRYKILVVEDNRDMGDFLDRLLSPAYAVYTAANGEEGLRAATKIGPDLIVSDVMMPVMNGYEMTRKLKEDGDLRTVPVILLTARADTTDRIEGIEFGADDYITKPFNSRELLARIRALLKTHEYEKTLLRRNREMEEDLEIARLLQQKLLPQNVPEIPGFRRCFTYIPMEKVGGDFYDFCVRDNFIDIFIADVSGHGLPGALMSTITKMALEGITDRKSARVVQAKLNAVISRSTVRSNYVTSFFAVIDRGSGIMNYCSAGHCSPKIHRRQSGEYIELATRGKPLGWFRAVELEEKEVRLIPGDRLFFYTDGITEAMNGEKDIFGESRLRDFIISGKDLAPAEFSAELLRRLRDFIGEDHFMDDLTFMVIDVL